MKVEKKREQGGGGRKREGGRKWCLREVFPHLRVHQYIHDCTQRIRNVNNSSIYFDTNGFSLPYRTLLEGAVDLGTCHLRQLFAFQPTVSVLQCKCHFTGRELARGVCEAQASLTPGVPRSGSGETHVLAASLLGCTV